MSEIENSNGTPINSTPDQLPPVGSGDDFRSPELREEWEAAAGLRAAQEGWLERRDLLEDTPRLIMARREFELLKNVGLGGDDTSFLIDKTRENYGILPSAQYTSVDIVSDDPSLPRITKVVVVHKEDFGTVVDKGQLEGHGIKPEDIPHITMGSEREFRLFGIVDINGSASSLIRYARGLCGVPGDDQYAPPYALIDIESDDHNLPNNPLLVDITEADFGTVMDRSHLDKDFQNPEPSPDGPLTPESGGAYITVDIAKALDTSRQGLREFAVALMQGETTDPFSGQNVDIGVRAGDPSGQKDAYVWENGKPFSSAVELTIAFPGQYNSVCVVSGQRRDPANGKPSMAQIENPTVVLKIEGEDLRRLQKIYRGLYHVPGFALTEDQRRERDAQFNDHLESLISKAASSNQNEERRKRARAHSAKPQLRARSIPGSPGAGYR